MAQPTVIQVTLSEQSIEFVRTKIASGEYSSESDVLNDSLDALRQSEEEQRRFEQEIVGPAHDELMADLSSAIPLAQVERNLAAARLQRLKAS